jgi:hypothetical protein
MKKIEELSKGDLIKADLYSRPNAMNGKYRAAQIGLDDNDLAGIKDSDIFFLETLKVRADSADKIFAEAKAQGKDLTDSNVMKELGEKINALGKPIHRKEAAMTAVMNTIQLMITYGITLGLWGLVFKKSFFTFSLYGVIAALIISLLLVAPVTASQRTKKRIQDISFGAGLMLVTPVIYIGIAGLVVWVIQLIFFR